MHEASLMAHLLRRITHIAQAHQAQRVLVVRLKLGPLSHCSPEHLQAHFDYAARGTMAAGARLEIEVLANVDTDGAQDVVLDSIEVEE